MKVFKLTSIGVLALFGSVCQSDKKDDPVGIVDVDGIRYEARTSVVESTVPVVGLRRMIFTTLFITNLRTEALQGSRNACPLALVVYRSAARRRPVWDSRKARSGCVDMKLWVNIPPGFADSFTMNSRANFVLADSLPAGQYYFSTVVKPQHHVKLPPAEIPSGHGYLAPNKGW
ncbi:MAG: hypothetical protein WKF55_08265 [Gemmatimonadaceae bacterium]